MKKSLLTTISILIITLANAQFACSCLPEGITFTTQAQIDSFQINYPSCTEVEGDITIAGEDISNLFGLNAITSIGGSLVIGTYNVGNLSLSTLNGLNNLTFIGGDLRIGNVWLVVNPALSNLAGLENLTSIGGDMVLHKNDTMVSLTGLEGLTSVEGNVYIGYVDDTFLFPGNYKIENLSGLNNLSYVGGHFGIADNRSLKNLTGLESLTTINGNLSIASNDSLNSLNGLDNLEAVGGSLEIGKHTSFWLGSNNVNPQLKDISALGNLSSIGENVKIIGSDSLLNLAGLENLSYIPGHLIIGTSSAEGTGGPNYSLVSLAGLNGIDSIGGSLAIRYNYSLSDISALGELTKVGGGLFVEENDSLTSLTGLDNLEASSISNLEIQGNYLLSSCEIQSICDYIANPSGSVVIYSNATGCNSKAEVEEACLSVYIEDESLTEDQINVYPNPIFDHVNISGITNNSGKIILRVYNSNGCLMNQQEHNGPLPGAQEIKLNIGHLPSGMYFVQLQMGPETVTKKVVKL